MKCQEFMTRYIQVERYEKLPLCLLPHFLYCKNCREKVRLMTVATHFSYSKIHKKVETNNALYLRTMEHIFQAEDIAVPSKKKQPFCKSLAFSFLTLSSWCIIGMFSLFAYIFLPSTKAGASLMKGFGHYFSLQFFIIIGLFFTAYTIVFIARNLELLSKAFRLARA